MTHLRSTLSASLRWIQLMSAPPREPRFVLHSSLTNGYWIVIFGAVNGLVALPQGLLHLWREEGGPDVALFGSIATLILLGAIAYCQRKARWLVAEPRGLTITERSRVRTIPWRDVRTILDLGYLGGAPAAKRYHIEFSDGDYFTFLGDPEAMKRLEAVRDSWTKASRTERR
jgi:hypothetical protein